MAKYLLSPEDFGLKLYNRFPPRYLVDDVEQKYALKRYLDALAEGGFKYVIEELNGITYLIDPEKTPYEVLILLYEQYGLEIFHGVPDMYLRMLLPYLSIIYNKKGSIEAVEYLSTVLSGTRVETEVIYDEYDNADLVVKLEMDYALEGYAPNNEQMLRILKKFVPFYLGLVIRYSYVYYEEADINFVDDYFFDLIKEGRDEFATIYRMGLPPEGSSLFQIGRPFGEAIFGFRVDQPLEGSAIFQIGSPFGEAIFDYAGDISEFTEEFSDRILELRNEDVDIVRPGSTDGSSVFQTGSPFGEAIFGKGGYEEYINKILQRPRLDTQGEEKGFRGQDSSFSTIKTASRKNATLGKAIIGKAVLNDESLVSRVVTEDY